MASLPTALPLPGVEARPGAGHYAVLDHGAQAWAWQPDRQRSVLWSSARAAFAEGRALRGGVPLVFPWFGGGPGGALTPAHGFARLRAWRRVGVRDAVAGGGRLEVAYRLDRAMVGPTPAFPHDFAATAQVAFAPDHLQVDLEVTNRSPVPFRFEAALHTYLAVSDVRRIELTGLEGAPYLDQAPGAAPRERVQAGPVTFEGETDRVYRSSGPVAVDDPAWSRRLEVTKGGSASTVVWNPWIAKAAAMADFGDDEWPGMLCVEAGNLGDEAVALAPGASHRLWQRVTLRGA